jgi:EPS-associated MarR family transcriptional regulator|tara:strand:- start:909 stop:1226 length:318 start_codon:yes stop_codon:yes gene_type:complete
MFKKIDEFNVLRKLNKKPTSTQRELAKDLNLSLGKINYCLKALNKKGLIKLKNFKKNPNKFTYTYLITPKGISEKTRLTINFMKLKMKEYDELKNELSLKNKKKN